MSFEDTLFVAVSRHRPLGGRIRISRLLRQASGCPSRPSAVDSSGVCLLRVRTVLGGKGRGWNVVVRAEVRVGSGRLGREQNQTRRTKAVEIINNSS